MEDLAKQGMIDLFRTGLSGHPRKSLIMRTLVNRAVRSTYRRTVNWFANHVDTPVLVLMYHRVTKLPDGPSPLAVSPANFRDQISWLRSRYPIIRMESDWSQVREPSVVITFDDGYADNVKEALPILEELEAPATFFVTTGYVGRGREFWWDDLQRIVMGSHVVPSTFEYAGLKRRTETQAARKSLFDELKFHLKCLDPDSREDWLAALRKWSGVESEPRSTHIPMDVASLTHLASSPLATIGAHTVSHPRLSALSKERQWDEISGSKAALEELIGKRVQVFAYPYGSPLDYSAETVKLVREAGFTKAVSTPCGQVHSWTDPLQIPRFWVDDWDNQNSVRRLKKFWII